MKYVHLSFDQDHVDIRYYQVLGITNGIVTLRDNKGSEIKLSEKLFNLYKRYDITERDFKQGPVFNAEGFLVQEKL